MKFLDKLKHTLRPIKVLRELGYYRSVWEERPLSLDAKPIPWLTYPAIDFLKGIDLTGKRIFEFGSGHSTLFWLDKDVGQIISIESDKNWHARISEQIQSKIATIHLATDSHEFSEYINKFDDKFDLILIDGEVSRYDCAVKSAAKLNKGGVIILDNSDHYEMTARYLRLQGFIQVDMAGFGPVRSTVWTTSFFFSREYNFQPVGGIQPQTPIGGTKPSEAERKRIEGI